MMSLRQSTARSTSAVPRPATPSTPRAVRRLIAGALLAAAGAAVIACDDSVVDPPIETATTSIATAFTDWSPLESIETAWPGAHPMFNTADLEGCPNISADGRTFFIASNRTTGSKGGLDIWYATRSRTTDPWGEPVNAGDGVNSSANDFCPTLTRDGHLFFFVSNRPGGCGGGDIYMTRRRPDGWDEPENLGCGVNSAVEEASPFLVEEPGTGPVLYFSSNRPGGFSAEAPGAPGDSDIYRSVGRGGAYGAPELVDGVNTVAEDGHPNVRHDALEIVFFSTRAGSLGMADIYSSTRASTADAWSTPVNLGPNVNSPLAETRPSLSWDGTRLYVGSARLGGEGSSDIYEARRTAVRR